MHTEHPGVTGRKLPARLVAARYSVVVRSLDRWCERPELGFPQPTYINGRKYWDEAALDAWDRLQVERRKPSRRAEQSAPAPEVA